MCRYPSPDRTKTPSQGGVFVAGFSVPYGTSAEAVFAAINAYIDLLQVQRIPFSFLLIRFRFNAINYESFFTSAAVDNFWD